MNIDFVRKKLLKFQPVAVHLILALIVAIYAIAGAYAIRWLEQKDHIIKQIQTNKSIESQDKLRFIRSLSNYDMIQNRLKRNPNPVIASNFDKQSNRLCVLSALKKIINATKCDDKKKLLIPDNVQFKYFDICYRPDDRIISSTNDTGIWSFMDSLLFTFTVITTIGYGNVVPSTTYGRVFVIFYGLIGIPLTMLAIADLGKFFAELIRTWTKPLVIRIKKCIQKIKIRRKNRKTIDRTKSDDYLENGRPIVMLAKNEQMDISMINPELIESNVNDIDDDDDDDDDDVEVESGGQGIILLLIFSMYILIGSILMSTYEPEMNFFDAIYFNFVTLTTIGLGDIVPRSESYLAFTIVYIGVGLALTTIAIEIASDYLKRLHYFGRKIENVSGVSIWFGGKRLTMKQLVQNLGDQFNLPIDDIKDLNLDKFVESAIEVEAGRLPTLRPPSVVPTPLPDTPTNPLDGRRMVFADDDYDDDDDMLIDLCVAK